MVLIFSLFLSEIENNYGSNKILSDILDVTSKKMRQAAHRCEPYRAPKCTLNTEGSKRRSVQCGARRLRNVKYFINGKKISNVCSMTI